MELLLSIVLKRIALPVEYLSYLKIIHNFLLESSILGQSFRSYFLQVLDMEEATAYRVPGDFEQFYSLLKDRDEAPTVSRGRYYLGLWNGQMDVTKAFSLLISLSCQARDNIALDHKSYLDFTFVAAKGEEYLEKKQMSERIIELSTSYLPFKYATFMDRDYIRTYQGRPSIILGGSLYGLSSDFTTVDAFKRPVSGALEEISPVEGAFDVHNPAHIEKAHVFEKRLMRTPKFQQLLLR